MKYIHIGLNNQKGLNGRSWAFDPWKTGCTSAVAQRGNRIHKGTEVSEAQRTEFCQIITLI